MKQGNDVLFAYEEAIGFMFGTTVLDKDGISAAAVMAEYAIWLYSQGKTFSTHLEELYVRYNVLHARKLLVFFEGLVYVTIMYMYILPTCVL
jgi:phosphomannomutase